MQRLGGDTAGAKVTAQQARNTLEQLTEINLSTAVVQHCCLKLTP